VALTRARDRLYVCGFQSKKAIRDGSWYQLAQVAAAKLGVQVTSGEGEITAYGTLDNEEVEAAATGRARRALPAWMSAPAPQELHPPHLIRPSDAVGLPPPPFSPLQDGAARFRRGLLVHALLARLPDIAPEQRRAAAAKFLEARGWQDSQALVDETLAVLEEPSFAEVFAAGSRAEVDLLAELDWKGARMHGRIDRLAITNDRVLILDFKTNRPPPVDEAHVPQVYLAQMALYREGAKKLFPDKRVVCGLVFTDGPRLLQLSDVVLDAQIAGLSSRLDPEGGRS